MRPVPHRLFLALFPLVLLLFFQPHTPMLPVLLDANPLYPIYAKLESGYAGQSVPALPPRDLLHT